VRNGPLRLRECGDSLLTMVVLHRSTSLLLLLLLVACEPAERSASQPAGPAAVGEPVVHRFGGPTMGSTYEVKFVGGAAIADVHKFVTDELAAFDLAFSQWREDSEIARANAHASTEPLSLSPRFAAVLQDALAVAAATDGAFDPTVKPLSDLYRAAKKSGQAIEAVALAAAKARVGYQHVQVRDGALVKLRPDVQLDLDGLVAGAACDAIAAKLPQLGATAFYLEVTGEVLCRGEKAPGQPWRIGVVDPRADVVGDDEPLRVLALRDASLCTSGDYRNRALVGGKLLHHVFDPRTGSNPEHRIVSASVLAERAAIADAFGTAFLVLGTDGVQAIWPRLAAFGVRGALLLGVDAKGELQGKEFTWPHEER